MASKDKNGSHQDLWAIEPEKIKVVTDPKHPLYDDRVDLPVSESLVLNILFEPDGKNPQGVLRPVDCIRDPETGDILLVDGRQRHKAILEANRRLRKQGREPLRLRWIPRRGTEKSQAALMVSSNHHAQEETPLGQAKRALSLMERGFDHDDIGKILGKSPATIKNLVALLDAPAAVRKAVESEQISVSDGYKLAKLEPDEAKKRVEELKEKAPRTPGKKRSKNAKKAREIVTGRKEPVAAETAVSSSDLQAEHRIKKMLKVIETSESINENKRMGAVAALQWALGDEDALSAIMDVPAQEETGT